MSYYVNRSDGNIAAVVEDGTLNTQTTLKLIGVGYANYAEAIAENFVDLMESFAGYNPPANPLEGQLWYNKSSLQMQVFDGDVFLPVNNVKISSATPTNSNPGDFWYNSDDMQLLYLRGDQWQVISPAYTQSQGRSEVVVETLYELNGTDHTATTVYASGLPVLIISSDSRYQPYPYIDGYNWINPGINIPSYAQTQNGIFWGGNGNAYASGGITVGGSNGQLQFNNSGFFGGASGLTTSDGINLQSTGTISATTITGAGLTSTVSGIRFPDNTVQTTAGVNNPYVLTGNGSVYQVPRFDAARNLVGTSGITTNGNNLDVTGAISATYIRSTSTGFVFPDATVQTTAAFNDADAITGTGTSGMLSYFNGINSIQGTTGITTNGLDMTISGGVIVINNSSNPVLSLNKNAIPGAAVTGTINFSNEASVSYYRPNFPGTQYIQLDPGTTGPNTSLYVGFKDGNKGTTVLGTLKVSPDGIKFEDNTIQTTAFTNVYGEIGTYTITTGTYNTSTSYTTSTNASLPTGTWRCMGTTPTFSLFLRIS
jgi:hypothetical protein